MSLKTAPPRPHPYFFNSSGRYRRTSPVVSMRCSTDQSRCRLVRESEVSSTRTPRASCACSGIAAKTSTIVRSVTGGPSHHADSSSTFSADDSIFSFAFCSKARGSVSSNPSNSSRAPVPSSSGFSNNLRQALWRMALAVNCETPRLSAALLTPKPSSQTSLTARSSSRYSKQDNMQPLRCGAKSARISSSIFVSTCLGVRCAPATVAPRNQGSAPKVQVTANAKVHTDWDVAIPHRAICPANRPSNERSGLGGSDNFVVVCHVWRLGFACSCAVNSLTLRDTAQ